MGIFISIYICVCGCVCLSVCFCLFISIDSTLPFERPSGSHLLPTLTRMLTLSPSLLPYFYFPHPCTVEDLKRLHAQRLKTDMMRDEAADEQEIELATQDITRVGRVGA